MRHYIEIRGRDKVLNRQIRELFTEKAEMIPFGDYRIEYPNIKKALKSFMKASDHIECEKYSKESFFTYKGCTVKIKRLSDI